MLPAPVTPRIFSRISSRLGSLPITNLSNSKYEVTSKIGSAIIVDVHFHSACLYSGLEVLTLGFELSDALGWPGFEGGMGAEYGLGEMGAPAGVILAVLCCCDGMEGAGLVAVLCFLAADVDVLRSSGVSTFGVDGMEELMVAFEAGGVPDFAVMAVFAVARDFGSAVEFDVAFVFNAFAFVASVFFACVVALTSFSAAAPLVDIFFVLMGVLALGAFVVDAAAAVSFKESFSAWAFFGRVVETCRTL